MKDRLQKSCNLTDDDWTSFKDNFVYWPRNKWDKAPEGFKLELDVFPWRYQRRLSIVMRPIVAISNEDNTDVLVSISQAFRSYGYYVNNILNGHMQQELLRSDKLKSFMGKVSNKKGTEFEDLVERELEKNGMEAIKNVEMSALGAPEKLGEVDIFSWDKNKPERVFVIECKRLKGARNTAEIGDQLQKFKGDDDDSLGKHINRYRWINENSSDVLDYLKLQEIENIEFVPFLVTNRIVPMQFNPSNDALPSENICNYDQLEKIYNMNNSVA